METFSEFIELSPRTFATGQWLALNNHNDDKLWDIPIPLNFLEFDSMWLSLWCTNTWIRRSWLGFCLYENSLHTPFQNPTKSYTNFSWLLIHLGLIEVKFALSLPLPFGFVYSSGLLRKKPTTTNLLLTPNQSQSGLFRCPVSDEKWTWPRLTWSKLFLHSVFDVNRGEVGVKIISSSVQFNALII